ncbi:hypothetical protein [Cystobacter ferrugineus]|uniref:Uncharacterized protein n=1 Tax=Cystobacter ferrugineus TaxID=83449 RepID=A0A1L9BHH9_9BACT|nr:hypothetical protein [Cystobacter ferrugineus]OJH41710.1 hypothetical protein BON30_00215 [Cystobacter ferrugineus]
MQKANALEFSATNDAVEWLKRNRKEVLVGSIVIIAGAANSEQHEALRNSRIALHFILERNEAGAFEEFFKNFNNKDSFTPVLSFSTKEEADAWLEAHPAPPHGAFVGVGQLRYHVAYARELKHRKLLPLPTQEEWARMEEEPEQEEVEEESNHPPPKLGAEFHLFDLLNVVCFYLYEMEQRMSSPEEIEALKTAKIAFHFVMDTGEEHGFKEYLETLRSSMVSPAALQSFSTREEAESWLARQPEPPPPVVVAIGRDLYSVGYNRRHQMRLLLRIPTPQVLDTRAP